MDKDTFKDMIDGAERINKPWKTAVIWLTAALIATNVIWGVNFAYLTYKAYEPTATQFQSNQNFEGQTQTYERTEGIDGITKY